MIKMEISSLDKYFKQQNKLLLEDFDSSKQKIIQIFNQDDLLKEKEKSFQEGQSEGYLSGYEQGKNEAIQDYETELLSHFSMINHKLDQISHDIAEYKQHFSYHLLDATEAIFRKILPYYVKQYGKNEIKEFVKQIIEQTLKKDHFTIYTPQKYKEDIIEKFQENNISLESLTFKCADNDHTFCDIQWTNGGASINIDALYEAANEALEHIKKQYNTKTTPIEENTHDI